MVLELELALRFLRRRSGLLRGTALAAFAGVTLATAALVITLALMTGYRQAIAGALQQGNAHLVGFSPRPLGLKQAQGIAESLAAVDGVARSGPVTYLSGLIEDPDEPTNPLPVVVKAVTRPPRYSGLEDWPEARVVPAVVGRRLARLAALDLGEVRTVQLPPRGGAWVMPRLRIEVVATFSLAFAEFDERWIVVPVDRVLAAVPDTGIAGIEVQLDDPMAVEPARLRLEEAEPRLVYTDWREMNRQLFAALRWQTLSLFVVLTLVVAVASFQVSSALVVLAINKRRATGMLQALGATRIRVVRVLTFAGAMLGGVGVGAGISIGVAVSSVMSWLRVIRFPEGLARVYMVDHIPLVTEPLHLVAIAGVCGVLVTLASIWPAWRSARLEVVAALKAV
jgi:lipoprotein-releasing system permease protein